MAKYLALLLLAFAAGAPAQDRAPEYLIGAGDGLRISVFQNPNLTLETRVSGDGTINYPLIGSVRLGGLTIAAAERAIAQALERGKFLMAPQVNILPLAIRSSQVSVLGMVNRPGRFPMETFNTRLSEMLAIAGGVAPGGADVAILVGERDSKRYRWEIDIPSLFLQNNQSADVTVSAGDVIYVDRAPTFYIYGEVNRPGSYRIERAMTLRQALVQGGGPTPKGSERALRLHRRGAGGGIEVLQPTLDEPVRADDVLHVGSSFF